MQSDNREGPGSNIMIVGSEAIVVLADKITLENYGYGVIPAYSENMVENILEKRSDIDIVLIEILGVDGFNGAEIARHILTNRNIPILFYTDHSEKAAVDMVDDIPVYGYVLKSSGEVVLMKSIDIALRLHNLHKTEIENLKSNALDRASGQ